MCAWWIVRVNNRVAKLMYYLAVYRKHGGALPAARNVPLSKLIPDTLDPQHAVGMWLVAWDSRGIAGVHLHRRDWGIPQELEESAMIDGASVPRIFFQIVVPIMKPSIVSVGILEAMWDSGTTTCCRT